MNRETERVILQNMFVNGEFAPLVLSHVDETYFFDEANRTCFSLYRDFYTKHNSVPTREIMNVELDRLKLSQDVFDKSRQAINELFSEPDRRPDYKWLMNTANQWIRNTAVYNAVRQAVKIIDGEDKNRTISALPEIMTDAVSKGLELDIGTDYFADAKKRIHNLHVPEERLPFLLEPMNRVTNGGLKKKTLNVFLGGTNAGKTLTMCSLAADDLRQGRTVLYVTAEISEEEIAYRIDGNLLDKQIQQLPELNQKTYDNVLSALRQKWSSNLFIKEYPEHVATPNHVRNHVRELYTKRRVKPDIIYLDYINILASARTNMKLSGGSYGYVKSICEEFRALAKELDIPIVTASQFNRTGYNSMNPDLTEISESFGIAMAADLVIAMMADEEMQAGGRLLFKQLKSRYGNKADFRKFMVGVDYAKQKLYTISQTEEGCDENEPVSEAIDRIETFIDGGEDVDGTIRELLGISDGA